MIQCSEFNFDHAEGGYERCRLFEDHSGMHSFEFDQCASMYQPVPGDGSNPDPVRCQKAKFHTGMHRMKPALRSFERNWHDDEAVFTEPVVIVARQPTNPNRHTIKHNTDTVNVNVMGPYCQYCNRKLADWNSDCPCIRDRFETQRGMQ